MFEINDFNSCLCLQILMSSRKFSTLKVGGEWIMFENLWFTSLVFYIFCLNTAFLSANVKFQLCTLAESVLFGVFVTPRLLLFRLLRTYLLSFIYVVVEDFHKTVSGKQMRRSFSLRLRNLSWVEQSTLESYLSYVINFLRVLSLY